jgi:hypothetical protein
MSAVVVDMDILASFVSILSTCKDQLLAPANTDPALSTYYFLTCILGL